MKGFLSSFDQDEEAEEEEQRKELIEELTPELEKHFVSDERFQRVMVDLLLTLDPSGDLLSRIDLSSATKES